MLYLGLLVSLSLSSNEAIASSYTGLLKDAPNISEALIRVIERAVPALVGREVTLRDFAALQATLRDERHSAKAADVILKHMVLRGTAEEHAKTYKRMYDGVGEELVVVTHQHKQLQAKTAAFLANPDLADAPRIAMVSSTFPLRSVRFLKKLDFLFLSELGAFDHAPAPAARRLVALGGFCTACLLRSVQEVVNRTEDLGGSNVTIRFPTSLTYLDRTGQLLESVTSAQKACSGLEQRFSIRDLAWQYQLLGKGRSAKKPSFSSGGIDYRRPSGFRYRLELM